MKVKSKVAQEPKWDTLGGFCGLKENHICICTYKPIVALGEYGYNKVMDSFAFDKVGGFARVIVVHPLHGKLPRLLIVVCATFTCFYASQVTNQWGVIDELWEEECKAIVGPIIRHASNGDSRRRQLMLNDYKGTKRDRLEVNSHGQNMSATLMRMGMQSASMTKITSTTVKHESTYWTPLLEHSCWVDIFAPSSISNLFVIDSMQTNIIKARGC